MARFEETIAAPATPAGESAIAVVRVSGPGARRLAEELLGSSPPPRTAVHADYRDRAGALVDDALFTLFAGPHSYTGEDVLEISCHGNPFIVQRLLEDLQARGCRPAGPGEFTERAFLHGRMDLSQAEAVMDIIRARGDRALAAAQRQLRGVLGREVERLEQALIAVIAGVEARLDFPEEDLPTEDRRELRAGAAAVAGGIDRLLATARYGALLRDGVRTVLVGEPNAGKSSLLNRLLGWERALVAPEPGTTRDYLEERRIVGGHCIRFVDTAGLHGGGGAVERAGMARALEHAADADLVLLVLDATRPPPVLPAALEARLAAGPVLAVWNKTDLAAPPSTPPGPPGARAVAVSALTGAGLDELERAIVETVETLRADPGPELIAVNARHAADLAEARGHLAAATSRLEQGPVDELLAADLRLAWAALARIRGPVDNERMLDQLFATFCIGK